MEDSDFAGATDNALDFMAVQGGHVIGSDVHEANDWCAYAKGGSAYLRIEGNRFFNCTGGGFTAGQGSGFQFDVPAQIHYEAYGVKTGFRTGQGLRPTSLPPSPANEPAILASRRTAPPVTPQGAY